MAKVSPKNTTIDIQRIRSTSSRHEALNQQSRIPTVDLPLKPTTATTTTTTTQPVPLSTLEHAVIRIPQEPKSLDPRIISIIKSRIKYYKKWFCLNSILLVFLSFCFLVIGIVGIIEIHYSENDNAAILIVGCVCSIIVGLIIYPFRFWFQRKRLLQRIKLLENPRIVRKLDTDTWRQYMEYLHHDTRTKQRFFLNIGQQNSCIRCICRTSYTKAIDRSGGYIILFEQCLMIDDIYATDFAPLSQPFTTIEETDETVILRIPMIMHRYFFDLMVPSDAKRNDLNGVVEEINVKIKEEVEKRGNYLCCSGERTINCCEECLGFFSTVVSGVAQ